MAVSRRPWARWIRASEYPIHAVKVVGLAFRHQAKREANASSASREMAAEPLGHPQEALDAGAQRIFAITDLSQSAGRVHGRTFRVAAKLRRVAPVQGDQGGDIHQ